MGLTDGLFRLDGKVSVVTGGAKGIGMFYSEALAEIGSRVVVADIDARAVEETTARLGAAHPDMVLGVDLDVTRRESVEDMVARVDATWGRLDVLVNNAGLFAGLPLHPSPWELSDDEFDTVMAVNVRGLYVCTGSAVRLMARHGWGRVINIASALALKGSPHLVHYAASKAAVVNLTRSLAPVMARDGITVNAIAPGATDSPTVLEARAAAASSARRAPTGWFAEFELRGPGAAPRLVERPEVPEDLLGTLIYLASPASDFVTGQTIVVDGGGYYH